MKKFYVGHNQGQRETFSAATMPTPLSHGDRYRAVIGPFRTKRGADYMTAYGHASNPHLQTVADAEYYAKQAAKQKLT